MASLPACVLRLALMKIAFASMGGLQRECAASDPLQWVDQGGDLYVVFDRAYFPQYFGKWMLGFEDFLLFRPPIVVLQMG